MRVLGFFLTTIFSIILVSCETSSHPVIKIDKPKTAIIVLSSDSDSIQNAINDLPSEGGTVFLKAKIYLLDKGLHINRSNVRLMGEKGTVLRLKDGVNHPVILIGTGEEVPKIKIEGIVISELEIDGNKENQSSETDPMRSWIRNNCIDIRKADRIWLDKLNIYNGRSGGVVVSWGCSNIFIDNSIFHNNEFDGIALYDSEDILVRGFICHENKSAGISLDNRLKHVTFSSGMVKNNGDVGIFVRESEDLKFDNVVIVDNKSHGCFFSHNSANPEDTGVIRSFFSACSFLDNKGWGFWLASKTSSSPDNTILSSLFSGNELGAIKVDEGGELDLIGNIYKNTKANK